MLAGNVQVLIVAGANPVYDAPAFASSTTAQASAGPGSVKFADALGKVPFVVSLNDRLDETTLLADVLAPASHPFECWGDAALPKGLLAIQQPVIQPLFDTRGLLDLLVEWGAAVGDPAAFAAVKARGRFGEPGSDPCDGRSRHESQRGLALPARDMGDAHGDGPGDASVRHGLERRREDGCLEQPIPTLLAAGAPVATATSTGVPAQSSTKAAVPLIFTPRTLAPGSLSLLGASAFAPGGASARLCVLG